jgi:hypothetical protein
MYQPWSGMTSKVALIERNQAAMETDFLARAALATPLDTLLPALTA